MLLAALAGITVAAAHWGVADEPAAGTAAFVHAGEAITARLDHLAALAVAAGASNANALVGHFTLALTHREVAAVDSDAVPGCIASAHATGQHAAQVLHHAA